MLKIFIQLLFTLILTNGICFAQLLPGSRPLSMGFAMTADQHQQWAVFGNPAAISANGTELSFYTGRYYGLPELTDMAAVVSMDMGSNVISAAVHRYGNDIFNENRLRIGYKRELQLFSLGAAAEYQSMNFGGNYESVNRISVDAGILVLITGSLSAGARLTPVHSVSLQHEGVPEYSELSFGLSYEFHEAHRINADLVKDLRFPFSFRGGVEIRPVQILFLRVGITTAPETFSGGLGLELKQVRINIAVQKHWLLGLSPGMDMSLQL